MGDIKDFKHAIVRQKILDAVRKDLIGPTSDCEQLNEVPTSSYITGLLYPADTDVTEDENYNDVEFTEKNFDADGETLEAGIFEEEEPEDRVKGGFQKPSSIGVSFYVSDDVQKVNAYINWGKYYAEQVQGEVIDETLEEDAENKKVKLFLCESGNCLERQIMKDLPWDEIQTIINCSQDGFPYQNIQLPEGFEEKIKGEEVEGFLDILIQNRDHFSDDLATIATSEELIDTVLAKIEKIILKPKIDPVEEFVKQSTKS